MGWRKYLKVFIDDTRLCDQKSLKLRRSNGEGRKRVAVHSARCLAKFLLLLRRRCLCPIKASIGDRCTVDKASSHSQLCIFSIAQGKGERERERGERQESPSLLYNMWWSERLAGLVGNPLTRWNLVDVGAIPYLKGATFVGLKSDWSGKGAKSAVAAVNLVTSAFRDPHKREKHTKHKKLRTKKYLSPSLLKHH